jgi:hypothetical protein
LTVVGILRTRRVVGNQVPIPVHIGIFLRFRVFGVSHEYALLSRTAPFLLDQPDIGVKPLTLKAKK